jgi:hypothetical protein
MTRLDILLENPSNALRKRLGLDFEVSSISKEELKTRM